MTQLQLVAKLFHRDAARLAALDEVTVAAVVGKVRDYYGDDAARGDLYYYDKAELRALKTDFDAALAALVDQPVKIVALDAAPEPCRCERAAATEPAAAAAALEPAGPPPRPYAERARPSGGRAAAASAAGGFGRGRGAGVKGAKGGKGKGTMGMMGKGGTGGKGGGADPEAARAAARGPPRAPLVKSNGVPEYQPRKIQGGAVVEGAWQGATRNGRYDRNPNAIVAQDYAFSIPLTPGPPLAAPLATPMGAIGVSVNGVPLYNQYGSPEGGDAVEDESFDACCGHPDGLGRYRMFPASLASRGAYRYFATVALVGEDVAPAYPYLLGGYRSLPEASNFPPHALHRMGLGGGDKGGKGFGRGRGGSGRGGGFGKGAGDYGPPPPHWGGKGGMQEGAPPHGGWGKGGAGWREGPPPPQYGGGWGEGGGGWHEGALPHHGGGWGNGGWHEGPPPHHGGGWGEGGGYQGYPPHHGGGWNRGPPHHGWDADY
ncbi:hypothetical protein JL722_9505 [Aureococcus anophagefferens]|nr:hypothetical protein JL722_9505 [Aureococcus anophagefferens]